MNKNKFIFYGKNVIDLEIKGLQKLKKNLNTSFKEAVTQISKCQSKVIMCGVGKSGLIAAKIAGTYKKVFAFVIGGLFFIGGIMVSFMIPAPTWFIITDLVLSYIPMAWIGWKLAGGK